MRHFVILGFVLVLLLQGVTQAGAVLSAESQAQEHCDGHNSAAADCDCCADEVMLSNTCGSVCLMMPALLTASLHVFRATTSDHPRVEVSGALGPAYLPLNPPPIS